MESLRALFWLHDRWRVSITDAIYLIGFLFKAGSPPPPPGPGPCGPDPTPDALTLEPAEARLARFPAPESLPLPKGPRKNNFRPRISSSRHLGPLLGREFLDVAQLRLWIRSVVHGPICRKSQAR